VSATRLDKWLKVSRLIKRRTVAKTVVDLGRVFVNDREAKPSTEIKPGDRIALHMPHQTLIVEVLATPESVPAAQAPTLYRVVDTVYSDDSGHTLR
jgi:ribosomal 50S subunit-recycling heat shock protein